MQQSREKVVNGKITEEAFRRLCKICKMRGTTINGLITGFIDMIIRYTSSSYNLTPEMETLMTTFEHLEGWEDNVKFSQSGDKEIVAAIYLIQEKAEERDDDKTKKKPKRGIYPVLVRKPYFGQWDETVNIQTILDEFLCHCLPDVYKKLRTTAVRMECNSILECLVNLIAIYGDDYDEQVYRELFQDADRSEYGLKPHEGTPFRRKMHKDVDSMPGLDFLPFDQEW